jgi:hypothetical protein
MYWPWPVTPFVVKNELLQQTFANQNPLHNASSAHAAEVTTFAILRKASGDGEGNLGSA